MPPRWGRPLPGAPRTSPDMRFSRIRFLGCTRFRADLHSCPLQGPVAIPRSEVGLPLPDPTVSGTSFLCGLRTPVGSFAMWPAFPASDYYARQDTSLAYGSATPAWMLPAPRFYPCPRRFRAHHPFVSQRWRLHRVTSSRSLRGFLGSPAHLFLHATA